MTDQSIISLKTYLFVWIALLLLLLATLGSAYIFLGSFNIVLNFLIAVGKALLVLAFFMHLKYISYLTRIFAAAGFFWLVILFGLTMSDYSTRSQLIPSEEMAHLYPEKPTQLSSQTKSNTFSSKVSKTPQAEANVSRGRQVYNKTCSACHETGALGAPKIGDKIAWKTRVQKGLDVLVFHAVNGFKAMPPKGGNSALAQSDIRKGIIYMLNESGVELKQIK
ncbi:oxidase [Nitrosococcus wardiae]|uniref:Oxidase n=2 Tax=Nitrosococcus wardiae TaxID=1814290 RepID=A0A4P7C428_9GAMM|nr:oxidase [Nitrosococcus wardiae]